jgi:hypothetical protein
VLEYEILWGDGTTETSYREFSGTSVKIDHAYAPPPPGERNYVAYLEARAIECYNDLKSEWSQKMEITVPITKSVIDSLFIDILERFTNNLPIMQKLLNIMG